MGMNVSWNATVLTEKMWGDSEEDAGRLELSQFTTGVPLCYTFSMPRDSHLSIRVSADEKAALQQLADRQDVSLGQLARKFLRLRDEHSAPAMSSVVISGQQQPCNRSKELAWLQVNLARLQLEIPGQWVVIEGQELVAHGVDYPTVYRDARSKGVDLPFVEKIADFNGAVSMGL